MSLRRLFRVLVPACVAMAYASPALAHEGHAQDGLVAGFAHPWGGIDHLLAMAAIGWIALARSRGAISLGSAALPAAFVASMAAGAGLVWAGVSPALAEVGILISLLAAAGLLAAGTRAPSGLAFGLVALSGLSHGAAHGAESAAYGAGAFLAGFVVATLLLHALGMLAGAALARAPARIETLARAAGAVALGAAFAGAL